MTARFWAGAFGRMEGLSAQMGADFSVGRTGFRFERVGLGRSIRLQGEILSRRAGLPIWSSRRGQSESYASESHHVGGERSTEDQGLGLGTSALKSGRCRGTCKGD